MQTRAKTRSQTEAATDVDMAEVATPEQMRSVSDFSSQISTFVQAETGSPKYSTPGTEIDNSPSPAVSNFDTSIKGSEENSSGSTPITTPPFPPQQNSLVVILTFRNQIIAKGVIDIRAVKGKGKRSFDECDDVHGEMSQQSTKHQKVKPTSTAFEEINNDVVLSVTSQTGIVANTAVNSNLRLNKKMEFVTEEGRKSLQFKTEELELQSFPPSGSQVEAPLTSGSGEIGDADTEASSQDKTNHNKEKLAVADKKHAAAAADKNHTVGKRSITVKKTTGRTRTTLRRRALIEKVVTVENPGPQAFAPQALAPRPAGGKTKNIVRVVPPPEGWTNKMRHKLGYSGMEAALGPGPGTEIFWTVFNKLRDYHAKTGKPIDFSRNGTGAPLHAAGGMTVDTPVQVMLSQATANPNALNAIKRMRQVFVVMNQNGEKGSEKALPNYHLIRTCEEAKLRKVIILAGLFNKRAKAIQDFLNMVYERNFAKLSTEEKLTVCKGNPPEATEFVPGLLSLDYLNDFDTDQALYDHILSWPLFGIKSACCVLAFGLGKKVFAVDTHVHGMAILLGWIPASLSPENACKYLDALLPDDLKYPFHQACWHHKQVCVKCQAGTTPKTKKWDECVCPLEEYIKRDTVSKKRPTKSKSSSSDPASKSSAKKIIKKEATFMPYGKMTPEEAEHKGYELFEADQINDDFGTDHGNLQGGGVRSWIKKMVEMDSGVASATIETKTTTITMVETISLNPEDPVIDTANTEMDDWRQETVSLSMDPLSMTTLSAKGGA